MKKVSEKIIEILRVGIYSFAIFGVVMFLAYIFCKSDESRQYISMEAVTQLLIYTIAITISVTIFLTDIVFEKLSNLPRIIMFFASIYIEGIIFFHLNAPKGPFYSIGYFLIFSSWLIWFSIMGLLSWSIYSNFVNTRYNDCLEKYKKSLDKNIFK